MEEQGTERVGVRWNTSGLTSSYCNVASAIATQTDVVLNLGVSQRADRVGAGLKVELLHRVVLNPRTAKHLYQMLGRLLGEYDGHRGALR